MMVIPLSSESRIGSLPEDWTEILLASIYKKKRVPVTIGEGITLQQETAAQGRTEVHARSSFLSDFIL
jgi:hypothetical protein